MCESQSNTEKENIKKFLFSDKEENIEIVIPELLQAGYSFYTWPSAHILAWFLWPRRDALQGKRILELGSGTSLPGILAAKVGAHVTLSDCATLAKTLTHIRRCCVLNDLSPGIDIQVIGLSWGQLTDNVFNIGPLDLIIGSDCFYDPTVFEDILVTVSFLLERNPLARFIFTYQERSADWSIENLLKKWDLKCSAIDFETSHISETYNGGGNHTIHLFEITLR